MAQATTEVQRRIDFLLKELTKAWQEIPEVECVIDSWDLVRQIDYVEEWAPKEALLDELNQYDADGLTSDKQRERYATLLSLISEYRPILEKLRSS